MMIVEQDMPLESQDPRIRTFHLATGHDGWASAATFRGSDKRGGANGRAFPRAAKGLGSQPAGRLVKVLPKLEAIQRISRRPVMGSPVGRRSRLPTDRSWAVRTVEGCERRPATT